MRLIVLLALLSQLSACVVYGSGGETGIITPLGATSTSNSDNDDKDA